MKNFIQGSKTNAARGTGRKAVLAMRQPRGIAVFMEDRKSDTRAGTAPRTSPRGARSQGERLLKHVPKQLRIDFVMELDLWRLHLGSEQSRATVGGGLL